MNVKVRKILSVALVGILFAWSISYYCCAAVCNSNGVKKQLHQRMQYQETQHACCGSRGSMQSLKEGCCGHQQMAVIRYIEYKNKDLSSFIKYLSKVLANEHQYIYVVANLFPQINQPLPETIQNITPTSLQKLILRV